MIKNVTVTNNKSVKNIPTLIKLYDVRLMINQKNESAKIHQL